MKFNFPNPETRHNYELFIETDKIRELSAIATEKKISVERLLEVFIDAALDEYRNTLQGVDKASDEPSCTVTRNEVPPVLYIPSDLKSVEVKDLSQEKPKHPNCLPPNLNSEIVEAPAETPKKKIKRVLTPEEITAKKAEKAKHAREYYRKNKTKKDNKKSAPKIVSKMQDKLNQASIREDEHIKSMVVACSNPTCQGRRRFIKDTGFDYKGNEYCRKLCIELVQKDE